jgi:hypothetical protein
MVDVLKSKDDEFLDSLASKISLAGIHWRVLNRQPDRRPIRLPEREDGHIVDQRLLRLIGRRRSEHKETGSTEHERNKSKWPFHVTSNVVL